MLNTLQLRRNSKTNPAVVQSGHRDQNILQSNRNLRVKPGQDQQEAIFGNAEYHERRRRRWYQSVNWRE